MRVKALIETSFDGLKLRFDGNNKSIPLTLILSHQGRGKNKIELSHQGRFGRDLIYQVRKLVYRTDIGARPVSGFFITTAWAAARAEQGRLE